MTRRKEITTGALLLALGGALVALIGCVQLAQQGEKPAATTQAKPAGPQGDQLKWIAGMDAGTQAAAASKRPMVVDVGAVWCGWCKKLAEESFPDPAVQALGDKFVWVRVDADADPGISRKYRVEGLPTILVLDATGGEISRLEGFVQGPKLAAFLSHALSRAAS